MWIRNRNRRNRLTGLLLGLPILSVPLLGIGCQREDTERIGRLGRKLTAHVTAVAPSMPPGLAAAWDTLATPAMSPVERHVRDRLINDQGLGNCVLEISQVAPGVIKLSGTVEQPGQKVRAAELTKLTIGVQEVIDELTVAR
ncbi:BON domain-containing protein [Tuwongella immobilis]|uniref:: BON n=1 Tax=Tuwongella immobilis TaxID=692036 RepID=A0A6C2YW41_9BACT|nr:BON domain-containing protein [Tuwongella immobilis]VIP05082.1 : BON [Tuwongella immobilis]VTS07520.1 : BON [Tuwongella immobilis]